ncbi:MAG TPA: gliding motility-associated C-terminal domain-containing protein [Bacteroidia bacterium]|jgi:gliding motility-associated-like protein|nr:gliding motility-associated C-terminal domain-containing protein [Bacteroidia bacterium]
MKKIIHSFFLLAALMLSQISLAQYYKVVSEIQHANCDEKGGANGFVKLQVSGVHGLYTYSWNTGDTGSEITNQHTGSYQATIFNGLGHDTTLSFFIPQWLCDASPAGVFTPNGDGINDTWFIGNTQYYPNLLVVVYNRWGQVIYQHKGLYEPWDGKSILGLPVDDATYYYVIYEDAGDTHNGVSKGSVTIIR